MDETNTLISPYKKLKVGPPEVEDKAEVETVSSFLENICTKQEVVTQLHAPDSAGVDKQTTVAAEKQVVEVMETGDSSQNVNEIVNVEDVAVLTNDTDNLNKDIYIDNATAMLYTDEDCGYEGSKEVNQDSDTPSLTSSDEPVEVCNTCNSNNKCDETGSESLEDFKQTLNVVNACRQEIEHLIEIRKTEVEAICSAVNVGAIIKEMEKKYKHDKSSQESYCLEQKFERSDLPVPADLDESMTSESTDDLNSSTKTVVDVSGQEVNPCANTQTTDEREQDFYINDNLVNEENLDDTVLESCETQPQHFEHVYANVIVKQRDESERTSEAQIHGNNQINNDEKIECSSTNVAVEKNERSQENKFAYCTLKRIDGDGKEYDDNVDNYFCIIKDDDKEVEDKVQSTDAVCEETVNFDKDKGGMEPLTSYIDSLTTSRIAHPLCASTPVPKSFTDISEITVNDHNILHNAPGILGERQNTNPANKQGNSEPLCASTPLAKPSQGLRVRDMNIMKDESEKKHVKFAEKIENAKASTRCSNNYVNENDIQGWANTGNVITRKNDRNTNKEKHASEGTLKRDRDSKREKKKMKGVRIEKFKEYMGPGLTSGIPSEGVSDAFTDTSKKNSVRDSDIETCTLIEYKGFGLTGPLPDKPLQTSTPLPPVTEESSKDTGRMNTLQRCISGTNLGDRPAGTEGMLIPGLISDSRADLVNNVPSCFEIGHKLRQTVSESKFGQRANLGFPELNTKTLTRHTSDLGPQGYTRQNRLTGWLASVQAHKTQLPTLSENSQPASAATIKPDQAYPSVTSVKGDKSESNSNADKSDKSEKLAVDPKLLQTSGKLAL